MTAVRSFIAFAGLWSATAWASPMVLLLPAVGAPGGVTLSGMVLKSTPTGGSSTLSRNLRQLTSSPWEGAQVEVRFGGRSATTTSGHGGRFEVALSPGDGQRFEPGLSNAEAHVDGAEVGRATVDILAPDAPFFVVSDFDDTLAVTHIASGGAIQESLFKDASTQGVVEGMSDFYGCLREGKPARPVFALVSGSPVQYAPRITQFLLRHDFPPFGLYLRDLGPKTLSGYKQPIIRKLLAALPAPVVLVGDSGEKDPEVYAEIRSEFPGRVKAIYIREAGGPKDPRRFEGMLHFTAPREAAWDAVAKGLADAACVRDAFPDEGSGTPGAPVPSEAARGTSK